MADGQYNPFQGMLNPNMRQTSLWDLRMMSAANRMETPFERGARTSYGSRMTSDPMLAGLAGMANEPDYSQFTYNPAMRQQAVAAGVQPLEASQVKQNTLLPNTGFLGAHPRLSGALEGGLYSLAASHGGMTAGESAQGVAEGLIGGNRIRQGLYRQQFARPFEAAGMMEGIQEMKQKRDLQDADIQHLRALNQQMADGNVDKVNRLTETNRHNEAMEAAAGQRAEATRPVPVEGGAYEYSAGSPGSYDPLHPSAMQPATKGGWTFQPGPGKSPHTGAGTDFDRWIDMRNAELQKAGQPPMSSSDILNARGKWSSVPAGAGQAARNEANAPKEATAHRDAWIKQQMAKPGPTWIAAGVNPGDKDAAKKLGQFYDDNFGSPAGAPRVPTYNPNTGQLE